MTILPVVHRAGESRAYSLISSTSCIYPQSSLPISWSFTSNIYQLILRSHLRSVQFTCGDFTGELCEFVWAELDICKHAFLSQEGKEFFHNKKLLHSHYAAAEFVLGRLRLFISWKGVSFLIEMQNTVESVNWTELFVTKSYLRKFYWNVFPMESKIGNRYQKRKYLSSVLLQLLSKLLIKPLQYVTLGHDLSLPCKFMLLTCWKSFIVFTFRETDLFFKVEGKLINIATNND